jgi:hypothetical protein
MAHGGSYAGTRKTTAKAKAKAKMQGSLHCTTDGETVRCFGRDDVRGERNGKKEWAEDGFLSPLGFVIFRD